MAKESVFKLGNDNLPMLRVKPTGRITLGFYERPDQTVNVIIHRSGEPNVLVNITDDQCGDIVKFLQTKRAHYQR